MLISGAIIWATVTCISSQFDALTSRYHLHFAIGGND